MAARLIDEDGCINVGESLALNARLRAGYSAWGAAYLCGVCMRGPFYAEADALACIASHPKDVPPANEDR